MNGEGNECYGETERESTLERPGNSMERRPWGLPRSAGHF